MSGFDTTNLPTRGIKPLVSLLAHPKLAIVTFMIVLFAGIPIVFIKGKTLYATTATIQVAPRYMKNLRDDGELSFPSNTQYREFLEQQTQSVLRFDIVEDALRSLNNKDKVWPRLVNESERMSVDRLRAQLAVHSIPDTYMIEISLQSENKNGLEDVVNAVVKTYIDRMKTERIYGSEVRTRNLKTHETELVSGIQKKTADRTTLALQLGISAFSGKDENPYDHVLSDLRSALSEARSKRFDAEAKLNAFQSRGETDINARSIQEAVLIDPGLANLKSNLYKRRADLLVQLSGLKTEHPAHSELIAEMQRIEAEISTQTNTLSKQVKKSLLSRYLATLDQTRQVEASILNEFTEQEKLGASFASLYNRAMTLTLDIDQDRKELDTVRERLNELQAEENSFGFVRLASSALPPEVPFGPGKKKILLTVLVAALIASLVLPIACDLLDRRIYTVNDTERVLGIPALGWMVECSNAPTRILGGDQLRRMAGGMIREQNNHGTHVFAFSSTKPGAGSSVLALSLGRTLNKLGFPTLVVEANAFKPDARMRDSAMSSGPGLAQCLLQKTSPSSCVVPATDELPARVWVGNTGSQRHLDRLDRMGELITEWNMTYRFILVDIPPLLLSADAEIMAHNLEHLVMVVEASGITTDELRRVGRQIEKLTPAAVGVIVNRVRPFIGGGYLRDMLFEHLTGRKSAKFFIQPSWRINLNILLSRLPNKLFKFFSRTH